jgi:HPt (histidine-containing phosphotransfer) domain-containing protein
MTPFTKYTHINLDYLQEVLGDNPMVLQLTMQKFLNGTPAIMKEMEDKLRQEEIDDFGKLAHKLKSSAGFMGMEEAKNMLIRMEGICVHKDQVVSLPTLWIQAKGLLNEGMKEIQAAISQMNE